MLAPRPPGVWTRVAARLEAGHHYLVGSRFTAADLTFAALAAPLLSPSGYGVTLPPIEQLPLAAQREWASFREALPGQFALRLYREFRPQL